MKTTPYRLGCIIAAALFSSSTTAAIILDGNYVQVRSQLDAGAGAGSGSDTIVTDASAADTGATSVSNGSYSASGRATAAITVGPDLKSVSSSSAPDGAGLFPPSSSTLVRSSWRDVLLPNAPGAAASLNFNFSVHALLAWAASVYPRMTVLSALSAPPLALHCLQTCATWTVARPQPRSTTASP